MASPMSASTLVKILRAEGVKVKEVRNWRNHSRNHRGAWGPINGVMLHHTVTSGTSTSVNMCYNGHATLPGPLCHGVIDKDGTVYLVGNGRANHAGSGDPDVLSAVINERENLPPDNQASVDGNSRFYGFECVNLGNGRDPWPDAQVEAMVRASAAICRHYDWSANSVLAHKEWQPGKIDPRGPEFDNMNRFRDRIQRQIDNPGAGTPTPEEDDMPSYLSLGTWKNYELAPGVEDAIEWDHEYADDRSDHYMPGGSQFIHGPAVYTGEACITLSGVDAGATIQVRVSEVDRDSKDYESNGAWAEFLGTGGNTYIKFPFTDHTAKGQGVRIRMKHFSSKPVTVEQATVKALVWKR